MKTTTFFLGILVVIAGVAVEVKQVGAARRTCTNLFTCMPYLFNVPFKEIVNATYYYTGSLLKLSQISDQDWNSQMNTLTTLCDVWLNFDGCMDKDWIECLDWDQLASMVSLVGGAADASVSGGALNTSSDANARRLAGLNKTQNALSSVGWSMEDTKKSMKIGSHLCANVRNAVPYLSCMRDLLLSNETLINITIWYQAMLKQGCMQPEVTCPKIEKMNKMMGHWLYHGCSRGIEVLTDVVRVIFEGMMFTSDESCSEIFKDKTAADLFEAPYDKQTEIDFGNDIRGCNLTEVRKKADQNYRSFVGDYFTKQNVSRENFYHRMACKQKNIELSKCDIWPIPTTMPISTTTTTTTTTTSTAAPVSISTATRKGNQLDGGGNGNKVNNNKAPTTTKKNSKSKTTTASDYDDDDNNAANSVSLFDHRFVLFTFIAASLLVR